MEAAERQVQLLQVQCMELSSLKPGRHAYEARCGVFFRAPADRLLRSSAEALRGAMQERGEHAKAAQKRAAEAS